MVLDLLSEAVLDDCFLQSYEQFIHTLLTFPSLHKVPDPVRGDEREFSGVMPSGYRFAFQNLRGDRAFLSTNEALHRLALGEGGDAGASGMKPTELC